MIHISAFELRIAAKNVKFGLSITGMPANKYALIRYRVIDRLIRNKYKTYPGVEDLIEACSDTLGKEVSKSTIEKDIHAMKNDSALGFEAPIKYSKEYQGYYYTDPDYSIEDIPLNPEEINAIQIAANTLYQFKDIGIFKQYDAAIEKILNKVKMSPKEGESVDQSIQFEQQATVRGQEFLGEIYQAINQHKRIYFAYETYQNGVRSDRQLDPYLLKEYANRWYVIGYDLDRKAYRVFGLERMFNVQVGPDHFERKKSFKPENYFKHSIGITANNEAEPVEVKLKCNEVLTKYLESQPLHPSQKIKGENVSLYVLPTYELREKLLGYGNQVEVIAPDSLRDELKNLLREALENYTK